MSIKKEDRLNTIKHIITNRSIGSQEELLSLLTKEGFDLTQATLSRDLKYLKVGRIPSENGFQYVLSNDFTSTVGTSNQSAVIMGFVSIEFSRNIAVIKTLPAYSHNIADFIDKSQIDEIIGTVAGNDTVLAIMSEGATHKQVANSLIKVLPELKANIKI